MINTLTEEQRLDIKEHELELGCKLRIMTYTEWLAEELELELDLDTVTGLDADYDSLEIYNTLLEQCPLVLTVTVE